MFLIDIRVASSTVIVTNLYGSPGSTTTGATKIYIPVAVAASTLIEARCQSNAGSSTIYLSLVGVVANAGIPAGFAACTARGVDWPMPELTNTFCTCCT